MIDSHCHIDFKEFTGRTEMVVKDALDAGVHTLINIGADLQTSINSFELSQQYDCLYATVGIHPHDARTYNTDVENRLKEFAGKDKIVAIGEIGLDYYRNLSPREVQVKVFKRQLELAVETGLPIVIHSRESLKETIGIVRDYSNSLSGGVFHCFPGDINDANTVIDMGFYVSFGGVITFPGARMADVAAETPMERILLETDSPYLTPVPFRGKVNQPAYVKYVRDKLAELRGISIEEVEKITDRNCRKLFRLVEIIEG